MTCSRPSVLRTEAGWCGCIRDWKRLKILWPMWNKRWEDLALIHTDDHGYEKQSVTADSRIDAVRKHSTDGGSPAAQFSPFSFLSISIPFLLSGFSSTDFS